MFDEFDRLHECPELVQLLSHYADLGKEDRQVWQDRLMELEGVPPKELSKLHGELIAYDWVEQNTGNVVLGKPGVVAACYRVTRDGLRAIRRLQAGAGDAFDDELEMEAPEPVEEKKPRRKREPKVVKAAEVSGAAELKIVASDEQEGTRPDETGSSEPLALQSPAESAEAA